MAKFFKLLLKSIGLLFAVTVITAATLVCTSRLLTPVLAQHRADFETYASKLLQTRLSIANVRASWYQYQPEINLEDVTIYSPTSQKPLLHIDNLNILVSLFKSIWARQLIVSGVMVSGTSFNVNTDQNGNFSIQGFPHLGSQAEPDGDEPSSKILLGWLAQEQEIILHDVDLHYTGRHNENYYLSLHDLNLTNSDGQHALTGTATLHQKLSTKITLAAQWSGEELDPSKWTGKAYIYTSGLDLSQWFKGMDWEGFQINRGITTNKIWLEWKEGQLQQVQLLLQAYGLALYSRNDNTSHVISRLSGNFGWRRDGSNQIIAGDDVLIDLPGHLWPVNNFKVALQNNNGFLEPNKIQINYVDLADASQYLLASDALNPSQRQWLQAIMPQGSLQNTTINLGNGFKDFSKISLTSSFNQLSTLQWDKIPGFDNVSGMMTWNGNQGDINIASKMPRLKNSSLFANDIKLDSINGSVHVEHEQDNIWRFNVPKLALNNNDLNATVAGSVIVPPNISPIVDLKSDFSLQHAEHINTYLPLKVFDKELVDWLKQAIKSGSVEQGHAELQGILNKFPFDDGTGTFLITGNVKNATLNYASSWPLLEAINARLSFVGRRMTVDATDAAMKGVAFNNIHAEIPYLGSAKPAILTVKSAPFETDFEQGFKVVRASPLSESFAQVLKKASLSGPFKMSLNLNVPLHTPANTHVQAKANLNNDTMTLKPRDFKLNRLNGDLEFTENSVKSGLITAELFNKPIQFNLATTKNKDDTNIIASFNAHLDSSDLENWLKHSVSKIIQGSTNVAGNIIFSYTKPLEIHLNSKLVGMEVKLPDQYAKLADEPRNLSLDLYVDEKQPLKVMVNYADLLSAAALLAPDNNSYKLSAADVHLGTGEAAWPDSAGLYVSANFKTLDWNTIRHYFDEDGTDGGVEFTSLPLSGIEIQADQINLAGLTLPHMHVQVTPEKTDWFVSLESPDISGQLQIPHQFTKDRNLIANFNKLNLQTAEDHNQLGMQFAAKTLPAIIFNAQRMSYNNKLIGKLSFKTIPNDAGLTIQTLQISSPCINLKAQGKWIQNKDSSSTLLQGAAASWRVDDLLQSLGFDAHNFIVNSGRMNFNLMWNAAPYDFSLNTTMGSLSLSLGKGRIANVGQGDPKMDLGKMLSIFSLQTIPRRLSLDFSDVFEKGYSFDSIRGDMTLKNGNIYTHNFKLNGPSAMVGINGRIGLMNKDYDFTLIVTPYITSSIPAALMFWNPLVGLAAYAADTVIGPSLISKAATYYYSVTGPWSNPSWKSISMNQVMRH